MSPIPSTHTPRLRRRVTAGFSLVELLIAGAILASAAMGIYTVFLRMNEAAADLRFYTSGKLILERAVAQALTVEWTGELETTGKRPAILANTNGNFVVCDIDYDGTHPGGVYPIYAGPDTTSENMPCTLYRRVTEVPIAPAGAIGDTKIDDGKTLLQIAFRLDYTVHGRTKPSLFFYTARARTKS
jgi:prepilin-type N-terminal cleavage/methylation domain-containing protein